MRRFLSFLLLFVLLLSMVSPALAQMEDKLSNHWAKNKIQKDFLSQYFPYLAKENFKGFDPNGIMKEDEFLLSFSLILKEKGYSNNELGLKVDLTRGQMARIVGNKLIEENIIPNDIKDSNFVDIKNRPKGEQDAINALYNAGIIKGVSNTKYNPLGKTTQAEAIVLLQSVEKVLDEKISIPFALLGMVQSYSTSEGITTKDNGEKLIISITKSFPTPGYDMKVEKIMKSEDGHIIYLDITPPDDDSIQLQVITYKTITIEVNKKDLGDPPYIFKMEGVFCQN